MNEKYMWAVAAFALGIMLARDKTAANKATTAHNEVTTAGDWWTFAGMWQAG